MSFLITLLLIVHVILCILLVLVVLMQRPRSEGLGAAFGGGFTEGLFGAQTTHVLQKFTVYLGIGFFVVTLLLAILYAKSSTSTSRLQKELLSSTPAEQSSPLEPSAPTEPPLATPHLAPESPSEKNPASAENPAHPQAEHPTPPAQPPSIPEPSTTAQPAPTP